MRSLVPIALALAVATMACKKRRNYDRSTPESTLAAFFSALEAGDIPERLEEFVASTSELETWRLRCESRGCSSGTFKIVARGEGMEDSLATLYADYAVRGEGDAIVIKGTKSPIELQLEHSGWKLTRFGRMVTAPTPARPAHGAGDAGPGARDAGEPGAN